MHSRPYESLLLCCLKTANGNGEPFLSGTNFDGLID